MLIEPLKELKYEGEWYKDKFSGLGELKEGGVIYRGEFDLNKKVNFDKSAVKNLSMAWVWLSTILIKTQPG